MKCKTPECGNDVTYLPKYEMDENYHYKITWLAESICKDCKARVKEETQIHKDYTE